MHDLRCVVRGVVAQIIEPELVIGNVGDVGGICFALLYRAQVVVEYFEKTFHISLGVFFLLNMRLVVTIRTRARDDADREAEIVIDLSHPSTIATSKRIIHGDNLYTLPCERVEGRRKCRDERLAFAGAHLGDCALE